MTTKSATSETIAITKTIATTETASNTAKTAGAVLTTPASAIAASQYDVIVVGAGPSGITIARELSLQQQRVLILEVGAKAPSKESILGFAPIAKKVSVSDEVQAMRVQTTGGTTAMYFAVADYPPLDIFGASGVDLSEALDAVKQELPIAPLVDSLVGKQALVVRDSARSLGYGWKKNLMLVDQVQAQSGSDYQAKWKPAQFLNDAIEQGAVFCQRVNVTRVLSQAGRAIGVEYQHCHGVFRGPRHKVYAEKVVIAAGAFATPQLLRTSGLKQIAQRGYQCNPTFTVFARLPNLNAGENFVGCMSEDLADGISLGDANVPRVVYQMMMLDNKKLTRLFSYVNSIAVAVKVMDQSGGDIDEKGRYHKVLAKTDLEKLARGEVLAKEILSHAGGKNSFSTSLFSGSMNGLIRIDQDVGSDLQTQIKNLYVCDASLMPENISIPPTLTLVCLGKYLAQQLQAA